MEVLNIDTRTVKSALEILIRERDPVLEQLIAELVQRSFLKQQAVAARPRKRNMAEMRKRYAIHREAFRPLHELFADAPAAPVMASKLNK